MKPCDWGPHDGISAFTRRDTFFSSAIEGHNEKTAICKPKKSPHWGAKSAGNLTLAFPASRTMRNKFLLSPLVYDICYVRLTLTNIEVICLKFNSYMRRSQASNLGLFLTTLSHGCSQSRPFSDQGIGLTWILAPPIWLLPSRTCTITFFFAFYSQLSSSFLRYMRSKTLLS